MEIKIEVPAGTFTAREYCEEDEQRVLDLWRVAFGHELSRELWRWKYIESPFRSLIILCFDEKDDLVIVLYGGIPYPTVWSGRRVRSLQLMDIMSHPDYRKTGLFIKTADIFFDTFVEEPGSVLVYGFPGKYHYDIGAKYLQYSATESGVAYLEGEPAALARRRHRILRGRVAEATTVGAEFDRLWARVGHHFAMAVIRNAAFLTWRFLEHPTFDYSIFTYRSPLVGRLEGYAVVTFDGDRARIVDLVMPPGGGQVADLVAQVAAAVEARGATQLETWLPAHHVLTAEIEAAGFARQPEPLGIIPTVRSFDPDLQLSWLSENLYYTMADADLC